MGSLLGNAGRLLAVFVFLVGRRQHPLSDDKHRLIPYLNTRESNTRDAFQFWS